MTQQPPLTHHLLPQSTHCGTTTPRPTRSNSQHTTLIQLHRRLIKSTKTRLILSPPQPPLLIIPSPSTTPPSTTPSTMISTPPHTRPHSKQQFILPNHHRGLPQDRARPKISPCCLLRPGFLSITIIISMAGRPPARFSAPCGKSAKQIHSWSNSMGPLQPKALQWMMMTVTLAPCRSPARCREAG